MYPELQDILNYASWIGMYKIEYGWSNDIKYYVEDNTHQKFLLRISDIGSFEKKKKEFDIIKKFNTLSFPMSTAIDFGVCSNNRSVYSLLGWVEGLQLEQALGRVSSGSSGEGARSNYTGVSSGSSGGGAGGLTETEQFQLGVKAGRILESIHSIPVDDADKPAVSKIPKKLHQLELYEQSGLRVKNDDAALVFVKSNIDKICQTQPVYQHGDFHAGNLILTPDKELGVIDFNRWECGDRYEEFYKLQSFGVELSIPFCIGQILGYFGGEPPLQFWEALAVYVAHASLYSIKWAEKFGQAEIEGMRKRCFEAFDDYDNFNLVIPRWYTENAKQYKEEPIK